GPNYVSSTGVFELRKNGNVLGEMRPEQRIFSPDSNPQPTGIPHIRARLNEDVYLVLAGYERETGNPIIQAYINPLTTWVWIGSLVLIFGTLVALVPSKIKRISPRTRVVGQVRKTKETREARAKA
ncbi:MAG: hypothetical protein MI861_03170, partial [Pirellulales bacterium]|nr:hypothetical protein [Pirellulales bacterium]